MAYLVSFLINDTPTAYGLSVIANQIAGILFERCKLFAHIQNCLPANRRLVCAQ